MSNPTKPAARKGPQTESTNRQPPNTAPKPEPPPVPQANQEVTKRPSILHQDTPVNVQSSLDNPKSGSNLSGNLKTSKENLNIDEDKTNELASKTEASSHSKSLSTRRNGVGSLDISKYCKTLKSRGNTQNKTGSFFINSAMKQPSYRSKLISPCSISFQKGSSVCESFGNYHRAIHQEVMGSSLKQPSICDRTSKRAFQNNDTFSRLQSKAPSKETCMGKESRYISPMSLKNQRVNGSLPADSRVPRSVDVEHNDEKRKWVRNSPYQPKCSDNGGRDASVQDTKQKLDFKSPPKTKDRSPYLPSDVQVDNFEHGEENKLLQSHQQILLFIHELLDKEAKCNQCSKTKPHQSSVGKPAQNGECFLADNRLLDPDIHCTDAAVLTKCQHQHGIGKTAHALGSEERENIMRVCREQCNDRDAIANVIRPYAQNTESRRKSAREPELASSKHRDVKIFNTSHGNTTTFLPRCNLNDALDSQPTKQPIERTAVQGVCKNCKRENDSLDFLCTSSQGNLQRHTLCEDIAINPRDISQLIQQKYTPGMQTVGRQEDVFQAHEKPVVYVDDSSSCSPSVGHSTASSKCQGNENIARSQDVNTLATHSTEPGTYVHKTKSSRYKIIFRKVGPKKRHRSETSRAANLIPARSSLEADQESRRPDMSRCHDIKDCVSSETKLKELEDLIGYEICNMIEQSRELSKKIALLRKEKSSATEPNKR